jgi:hypothetical protein
MDPTRSREMPSCSAIDLAEIRWSSKIPPYDGLRTYQHLLLKILPSSKGGFMCRRSAGILLFLTHDINIRKDINVTPQIYTLSLQKTEGPLTYFSILAIRKLRCFSPAISTRTIGEAASSFYCINICMCLCRHTVPQNLTT